MTKKIEEYLHYYLGQYWEVVQYSRNSEFESGTYGSNLFNSGLLRELSMQNVGIKPILRKLSDMTEEEALTVFDKGYSKGNLFLRPDEFHCLLSRGFDLFGLIEAGLAIDKSTVK